MKKAHMTAVNTGMRNMGADGFHLLFSNLINMIRSIRK
jgi:hypothetical protein